MKLDISISAAARAGLIVTSIAMAATACADTGSDKHNSTDAVSSVAGSGSARFDWLERRHTNTKGYTRMASNAPGNGSWICSPAGFGKTSRCTARR